MGCVAIIFAGAGCLTVGAVGAVSAGSFVVSAWLVITVTVTRGWLDPGMAAAAALGGTAGNTVIVANRVH